MADPHLRAPLTLLPCGALAPREREILVWLAIGLCNKAIAARLGLRPKTVRNRVSDILSKLGATNRTEAAAWYYQHIPAEAPENSEGQ